MAAPAKRMHLPDAAVNQILQEVLRDGPSDNRPLSEMIDENARVALSRSCTVFLVYLYNTCKRYAAQNNRSRIRGTDVVDTVGEVFVPQFKDALKQELEAYGKAQSIKKQKKHSSSSSSSSTSLLSPSNTVVHHDQSDRSTSDIDMQQTKHSREVITIDEESNG